MTNAVMLEASLFQLKGAVAAIDDAMFSMQLKLTMDVLSSAVEAAALSLTPATLSDVEFALNDVTGTVNELSAADAAAIAPALEMVQADVAMLKQSTSLPDSVIGAIRSFQTKLRARRTAIERQTYRAEGTEPEELPHPPDILQREAVPLRQTLAQAGFGTPALDEFIAEPSSLRFQSISDIVDELEVIAG